MKAIILALLATTSGCFTSWSLTQAAGGQRILEERRREERVHVADVREFLHVTLPFVPRANQPVEVQCSTTQTATDTIHHSAFRYGSRWKKVALAMFVLEASAAAAIYFGGNRDNPMTYIAGGFFALDALGTAGLVFVPRKEVAGHRDERIYTPVRNDCPDGLVLEIAGETFPIDAAGQIGELGEAALDAWKQAPNRPLHVMWRDRTNDFGLGLTTSFEVPMGTLTQAVAE